MVLNDSSSENGVTLQSSGFVIFKFLFEDQLSTFNLGQAFDELRN